MRLTADDLHTLETACQWAISAYNGGEGEITNDPYEPMLRRIGREAALDRDATLATAVLPLRQAFEAAILDDSAGVSESERCRAGAVVGLRHLIDTGIVTLNHPDEWTLGATVGAAEVRAEFSPMPAPPDWFTAAPPESPPFPGGKS